MRPTTDSVSEYYELAGVMQSKSDIVYYETQNILKDLLAKLIKE